MFGLFKIDPVKKLQQEYQKKMEQARDRQRSGDIKGYAHLVAEAEEIIKKMESLKKNS